MDVSDDEGPREDSPASAKPSVTSDDVVAAMLEVDHTVVNSFAYTPRRVKGNDAVGV